MRQMLAQPAPDAAPCFIHRDYHPTNILFDAGHISGVVDWVNACVGCAAVDLAHCRNNLVCLYGVEAADTFLTSYRTLAAAADPYHPYWDLNGFAEFFGVLQISVYPPWLEFGMDSLTDTLIQRRADAYLASIFARF
jgi:aminoglycoside/choline kinase family phosphotransferase